MLITVALFASLSGYLFGYDLGLIGGALLNIQAYFGTSDGTNEVIVGTAKLGAFVGTFLGGALMLYYGRRTAIGIDSLFFIAGPVLMSAASNVLMLVAGRFVVGVGIGVSAVVVPAYLGEVSPAQYRGRVVELYEVLLCVGMLSAALGDAAFQSLPNNWRWMVGVPALPALVMSLALCLLPESPRWLVIHGRLDEALAVIHRIYTSKQLPQGLQNSNAEVNQELLELWSSVEKDKAAAEERRARRAAAREARQTKLAPLGAAGAEDGKGGVRYKGGWARLEGGLDPELEEVSVQSADSYSSVRQSGSQASNSGRRPPLPRSGSAAGISSGSGPPTWATLLKKQASGPSSELGPGPGQAVVASETEHHSSAGSLHYRGSLTPRSSGSPAMSPEELGRQAPLSQQQPLPPSYSAQGPAAAGVQQQQQPSSAASPQQPSGELASPFVALHARAGSSPSLVVAAEEVLPVPATLRRIRTRSSEFDVPQEDLAPLNAGSVPPLPSDSGRAAAAAPAGDGSGPKPGSSGPGSPYDIRSGPSGQEGAGSPDAARRATRPWHLFGQHGSLRARQGSTVPWTAQQAMEEGSRRGFWSTLGDMCLDVYIVFRGPERAALRLALWLAFFNQAFASTAIINYAPEVLRRAGVESDTARDLFTAAIGGSKMVGVLLSFFLVDTLGRRPLLIYGSLGSSVALALLVPADWLGLVPFLVLGMCAFIFAFSISWAGVFWVLLSEMFSMSVKSPAVSAATAMLFLTGAVSDLLFLSLHSWLGPFCFAVFSAVALAAGIYVARMLPETKERTLQEVQDLLAGGKQQGTQGTGGSSPGQTALLPREAPRSASMVELPGLGQRRRRGWLRWT
ncbi:hypothetical protein N2152v2_007308 [Parachlorella kessleri]